jgi:hypothetical protein
MSVMFVVVSFGKYISPFQPQQRFTSYLVREMVANPLSLGRGFAP